jgi:hypothetical protein
VQQQEWVTERYPADEGFYPDAFSITRGTEEYHWDLNPRLIVPCLSRKMGFALEPITRVVRVDGRAVAITAPGLKGVVLTDGTLQIDIEPSAALPALFLYISEVRGTPTVRLNGEPLSPVSDMDTLIWQSPDLTSGWAREADGLIVRLIQPAPTCRVEIRF